LSVFGVYRWCPFCWSSGQGRVFYPDVHEIPALGADSSAKGLVGPGREWPSQPEVYLREGADCQARQQGTTMSCILNEHILWHQFTPLLAIAPGPKRILSFQHSRQQAQVVRTATLLPASSSTFARGLCLTQSVLSAPHRPVVTYTRLCPGLSQQPQLYRTSSYLDVCLSSPFVKSPSTPLMTRRNSR
jgi:hypothetical protein